MKMLSLFILSFALFPSITMAKETWTDCIFKKNSNNLIKIKLKTNGTQLDTATAFLVIQTGNSLSGFTYYNTAFMVEAMNYREIVPYGRRAEFINFTEDLEGSGRFNFRVVNFQATTTSVEFSSKPGTRKELTPVRGKRRIGFDAVLKTILKTENTTQLENGRELSVNEVSCSRIIL